MFLYKRLILQCRCYQIRWKSSKSCVVYITDTINPYKNLAFENWMYRNVDFENHSCLFVWRNSPSIVVGRHQNPWKECTVYEVQQNGVNVCRRDSGGGTVYHDLGNANFTFFAHRKNYNRKHNLNLIVSALKRQWPVLDVSINKRDDIILNQEYKISGSASKLGRNSTYHHCTLLINADKHNVMSNLAKLEDHISSNATASVRSQVLNLTDIDETINFKDVSNAVASSYINNYSSGEIYHISTDDENLTPGIQAIARELRDWKWVYGKTPDFSTQKTYVNGKYGLKSITIKIKKGFISDFIIEFEQQKHDEGKEFVSCLCQIPFDYKFVQEKLFKLNSSPIQSYICSEILKLF